MGELIVVRRITVLCVSFILTLSTCVSDADKLTRLQGDQMTASLLEQHYRERPAAFPHAPLDSIRAWNDSAYAWGIKRQLAERELNKFMNGR
jgi:hypothetical protein